MSNSTITCHSCKVSLHASDEYSEDGCPLCGGDIHSPERQELQQELETIAVEQDSKAPF